MFDLTLGEDGVYSSYNGSFNVNRGVSSDDYCTQACCEGRNQNFKGTLCQYGSGECVDNECVDDIGCSSGYLGKCCYLDCSIY